MDRDVYRPPAGAQGSTESAACKAGRQSAFLEPVIVPFRRHFTSSFLESFAPQPICLISHQSFRRPKGKDPSDRRQVFSNAGARPSSESFAPLSSNVQDTPCDQSAFGSGHLDDEARRTSHDNERHCNQLVHVYLLSMMRALSRWTSRPGCRTSEPVGSATDRRQHAERGGQALVVLNLEIGTMVAVMIAAV